MINDQKFAILSFVVSASNGIIRPNVLQSGEIDTNYTLGTEEKTQNLAGIEIDQNITKSESRLRSGNNPNVSANLVNYVGKLNENAKRRPKGLIGFKERLLDRGLPCNLFTVNYLLLIEHIILPLL